MPPIDLQKKEPPRLETASLRPSIRESLEESQGYKHFLAAGELLRKRNGHQTPPTTEIAPPNLTSNQKEYRLEERFIDTVSAPELCQQELEQHEYLPFLGQDGFIRKGWAHLIAGYPKTGKTELTATLAAEWANHGESVLYVSEEPRSVWQARLKPIEDRLHPDFLISFALGQSKQKIAEIIKLTTASVVIIDTLRNLLGLTNENDNSEIAGVLNPFISLARDRAKTLVLLHHTRKGGGIYGEAIAGGHAILGTVDVALELTRHTDRRRIVKGSARVFTVPKLMYEMTSDRNFVVLGNPDDLAIEEVRDRLIETLSSDWVSTSKARELIGKPEPSHEQVRQALDHLGAENLIERDPPFSDGSQPGKTYKWRIMRGGG